ncbi:MAG: hypothetical protein WBN88_04130 [Anderseniella sp.]
MASTCKVLLERIEDGFDALIGGAAARSAETAEIMKSGRIKDRFDTSPFAASGELGAGGGVSIMTKHGLAPVIPCSGAQKRL